MNGLTKRLEFAVGGACINDIANLTNGTAEYNNASASKWPFNYANRHREHRPAIIKMFNSCQADETVTLVATYFCIHMPTSSAIKRAGTTAT